MHLVLAWVVLAVAAPAQHKIAGSVRWPDRRGAEGAVVTVRWRCHPELPGLVGLSLGDGGVAAARAVADDAGRWQLALPVRGPFEVTARSADDTNVSEPAFGVMAGGYVEQQLRAPFVVAGRARTEQGEALAGLALRIAPGRTTWSRLAWYGLPIVRGTTTTDAEGRFRHELPLGYLRHAFWEPFLSPSLDDPRRSLQREVLLRPTPGCRELDLVVAAPEPVAAIVVGPDGAPVGGAEVWERSAPWRRQVTDAGGRFAVDARALRQLIAAVPGLASDLDGAQPDPLRPADPPELQLGPTWPVQLSLRDAAGAPLADAEVLWVTLAREDPPLEVSARTDVAGRVTTRAGAAAMAGFVMLGGRFAPFVQLMPDGPVTREVTVAPRRVHGSVLNAEGTPVAAARVVARARGRWPEDAPECCWVTYTDHGGRYEFDALPPGAVQLFAAAGTNGLCSAVIAPEADECVLRCVATGVVEVEVFAENGETAAAGAWVTLVQNCGVARGGISGPAASMTTVVGFTDRDGRVRFSGLPEADWSVLANHLAGDDVFGGGTAVTTDGDAARVVLRRMRE